LTLSLKRKKHQVNHVLAMQKIGIFTVNYMVDMHNKIITNPDKVY